MRVTTIGLSALILTCVTSHVAAQVFGDWQVTSPIRVLVRSNGQTAASTPTGVTPSQMAIAYGFNLISNHGEGQIVGIVDAYDNPNIESDLAVFSTQFGLPACTTANGCFKKVFQGAKAPKGNKGWGTEIALDVEWVHAIAPAAKIVLVEADSPTNSNLYAGVDLAVKNGATVVSMSFGGGEAQAETAFDSHFNVPGVVFFASSGDSGNEAEYPAASPYVVGVGGTTLSIQPSGMYAGETAWSCRIKLGCAFLGGTGGGQSSVEKEPAYQMGVQNSGFRVIPDVSFDADPDTGVPVYDTYGESGWLQVGGTSFSSPAWAGLMAIVNSSRLAAGKAVMNSSPANNIFSSLYNHPANLRDITVGTNGICGGICKAGGGYDALTGLGTPVANAVVSAFVALP